MIIATGSRKAFHKIYQACLKIKYNIIINKGLTLIKFIYQKSTIMSYATKTKIISIKIKNWKKNSTVTITIIKITWQF